MKKSDNKHVAKPTPFSHFVNRVQVRDLTDRLTLIAPDLQLELLANWITPYPPVSGQPATIRFRIRNLGQKPALDFKTYLYMDGVQVGSWKFHHIDKKEDPAHQYQPLLPGQATKTFECVTSPLKGIHTLRWVVDAENEVIEQSEANNIFDTLITSVTKQQLPDLTAKVIEPTNSVEIGQEVTLKVKIANEGQIDVVHPFWVFVKSNGIHIITQEIPKLKAYESVVLERSIKSMSKKNDQIDVEVDAYNEINESKKNNNLYTMHLEFAAVDLEVVECRITPSIQSNCRPVISFDIRNKGKIDATRPFSVHLYEIGGGPTQQQFDVIKFTEKQLPKAGELLTITLPIKGWDYETGKIYVATKSERQFVLQVDPEFVYQKTLDSKNQILIVFSLYDIYKPLLQASLNSSGHLPEAYFFTFPGTNESGVIRKKIFAYTEISKKSEGGGGGSGGGSGSSDIDWAKPFVETAKWIKSLFTDDTDDKVRDVIKRLEQHEINAINDDQLVDMIEKLFDGPTLDEDENAANKVLEALPPSRFSNVVSKLGGLSAIDDEIDGAEWKNTLNIVSVKGQNLPLNGKLDLIKGLFDTTTYDAEERVIINLVKSMSLDDRWEMLRKPGFSKDDFDDQVDGSEWDELEQLLDKAVDGYWRKKPVVEIQQGQSCWAAALSSFLKSNGNYYEPAELQYLFANDVEANGGLTPKGLYSVRDYFGLEMEPYFPQVGSNPNQMVLRYDRITKSFLGPKLKNSHVLLIYMDPAWGGQWSHAIVVWGADSKQLCFMDPIDGHYKCEAYIKFPSNAGYIILWKK
ncbi:hypothetical protein HOP62_10705 [Halomonas sp. MCCC 1A17488]|uniref:CARDB domain-containing protein n=1 Tax=unclassified Halomonas TaxID=2609666 RepID=UPI0018D26E33|nr:MULTISPECIES: CARDB domain-containing protein [unclassified Halomonas]MCE8016539.1 hypothetical protein [Halomonas sp. MCCC 1A17488]MCG3239872.1 hypothetical protein [Halomonas sp. MCCC 1A17488]QPP50232.1 hypothetical protein I4484_03670 [Halomonas sp. SS10-MC5]